VKSTATLLVELAVLTLVCAFAAPVAVPRQAPTAQAQIPPTQEATGTIASIDQTCAIFVLLQQAGRKKTEITFALNPEQAPWTHEPDGCSFVSLGGKIMLVKPGSRLSVRSSELHGSKLVNWVVVLGARSSGRCEGQGGAGRTSGTIYQAGCDGVGDLMCIHCPHPPYPEWARKARLAGIVILKIVILPDGSVSDSEVVQSLDKNLDESATKTVRKWRFKPAAGPEGSPVAVSVPVEINFNVL
jgi:TonB family protein